MSIGQLLDFKSIDDERGQLVALEGMKTIPFPIKRIYYMTGLDSDYPRGFHAHKKLKQVAVCLKGRCRFVLDNGYQREELWLDSPTKGLYIGEMIWREMHDFSSDCVLVVLASEYYTEDDYIRDFQQFNKEVNNG